MDGVYKVKTGPKITESTPPVPRIRYAACIDLLGFRQTYKALGATKLAQAYRRAIAVIEAERQSSQSSFIEIVCAEYPEDEGRPGSADMFAEPKLVGVYKLYPKIIETVIFSDTFFIFTEDDSNDSCRQIAEVANLVFQVCLAHDLPTCGAIALGEALLWPEERVYLGDAIIDAYELQNSLDIVGIVVHQTAQSAAACFSAPMNVAVKAPLGHPPMSKMLQVPLPPGSGHGVTSVTPGGLLATFRQLQSPLPPGSKPWAKYDNGLPIVKTMLGI